MLTQEQHTNRAKGIGASEVAALFGLHPYMTAYELWLYKTGKKERPNLDDNERVWLGHKLEPVISDWYEKQTGYELVMPQNETYFCPTEKRLLCHPDRIVLGMPRLVELKTAQYNPDRWGAELSDECPFEYVLQCQAQMACSPAVTSVDLVVLFDSKFIFQIYHIKRNDDLIKKIINKVRDFWDVNVDLDIAPDLQNYDDVKQYFNEPNPQAEIEANQTVLSSIELLKEAKKLEKDTQATIETHKKIIAEYMGNNVLLKDDNRIIATWKANKNGVRSLGVK